MMSTIKFISVAFAFISQCTQAWNPKLSNDQNNRFIWSSIPRGGDVVPSQKKNLVLLIDVDNTLYSEKELASINANSDLPPWQRGIESQIVRNTHLFGLKYFNLTSEQCDDMYKLHGSTIEGIRYMLPEQDAKEVLTKFYKEVYDPIDFTCLLTTKGDEYKSGYDHGNAIQKRRDLAQFLKAICKKHTVYLCSNSPRAHIHRVMNGMGLHDVSFAGILTPDSVNDQDILLYPTKSSPFQYYEGILKRLPLENNNILLLDDSLNNLRAAAAVGIRGIHIGDSTVHNSARTLEEGLAEALGHILPAAPDPRSTDQAMYSFSDVKYLQAKNEVDFNSINRSVWIRLAQELALRLQQKRDPNLRIADLGAGILSMLELILLGGGGTECAKSSLLSLIHASMSMSQINYDDPRTLITHLEYYAYETNANLIEACKQRLEKLGFEKHATSDEITFRRLISLHDPSFQSGEVHTAINVVVTVYLRPVDFNQDACPPSDLDLIIGCCFADLFDPDQLAQSLLRLANDSQKGSNAPLVYFPITFTGTTQFSPAYPASGACLSDTSAFQMYSESLQRSGHNLDLSLIINSIQSHGGSLITQGESKWMINPISNAYLWKTMLYFFGMSGARTVLQNGLDSANWIERSLKDKRQIIVSNVDLLFDLGSIYSAETAAVNKSHQTSSTVSIKEIQFVAPYNVTTIHKEAELGSNQVEIESLYSLISSGTELKVFKGMFESAALDVNIKGMEDESMEYPLSYGYSLVGRVAACGPDVKDADHILGKLAFVFSPHSTRVVVDRDAIQLVPEGIEPEDAIFMPSVETALSLVHDANVRLGENVAIFGQGLIGLLVTAILSMQKMKASSVHFGSVTTFDAIDDRLAVSSMMGSTSALQPQYVSVAGPFDVSLEVSGNPKALQSAIDNTCDSGRVIVGSWYGNVDVTLKLGIDFHRSHKIIQTSQVSNIPCALTGLWSKERRFALTWELVKSIRPSRLISKQLQLEHAQHGYELLDKAQEIAICFKY